LLCPASLEKESFEVRKFLIGALVAGSIGVTGALALPAHATSTWPTGPTVTNSGTGGTLTVGTPAGCATLPGDAASGDYNPGGGTQYDPAPCPPRRTTATT
jgi:hypothetical protein